MRASRTPIHRALLDVDADHRAALPRWRHLIERVLRGDEPLTPAQRAQLLGVPGRRQVLRIGTATIAGATVLAACGGDDDGSAPPTTAEREVDELDSTVETREEPSAERDLVLLNTALSLEVLAVDTYQVLLESPLVGSATTIDVATVFQSHHAQHREALIQLVTAAGAEPFVIANPAVKAGWVDPMVTRAVAEAELVGVVHDLERAAAQTYVHAASGLSTTDLRVTAATISGVEARHAAILDRIAELGAEEPAIYPTDNPLPTDAIVPA